MNMAERDKAAASAAPPAAGAAAAAAKKKASGWVHFAAGGFGGMAGALVTCPLEVVKTRLQSSQYHLELQQAALRPGAAAPVAVGSNGEAVVLRARPASAGSALVRQFTAVPTIIGSIYRQEGLFALWRGLGPNLVGIIPSRAIYFFSYSSFKDWFIHLREGRETWHTHVLSAGVATFSVATTTAPLWMIKTRMQLQNSGASGQGFPVYRNSLHCLSEVVRKEGFFALYRGLSASYLGGVETAIQFMLYEKLKAMRAPSAQATTSSNFTNWRAWMDLFGMAASSKLVASAITYPHEVLRTRLREPVGPDGQLKYTGLRQAAVRIVREEGFGALYGGLGAHLMRVVPNAAIMFLGYEAVVHYFAK